MRYDPERTLRRYDNYKDGTNNLLILWTNPSGTSSFAMTAETVITTGSRNHDNTMKRHRRKLKRLNRRAAL